MLLLGQAAETGGQDPVIASVNARGTVKSGHAVTAQEAGRGTASSASEAVTVSTAMRQSEAAAVVMAAVAGSANEIGRGNTAGGTEPSL